MAVVARYLIDTSAAARMTNPEVADRLAPLIEAGWVATTAQLDAKALYSVRAAADYAQIWSDRRLAYEYLPTNDEHWQTALDAQRSLAGAGRHRAVGMTDLLIATFAHAFRGRCRSIALPASVGVGTGHYRLGQGRVWRRGG